MLFSHGCKFWHEHLDDPRRTEWQGFPSGTRAATAGGLTTLVDMPLNSFPSTVAEEAFELKSFMCPLGINDFPMTNADHIKVLKMAVTDAGHQVVGSFLSESLQQQHDHPNELLKCNIREKHQNSCGGYNKPNIPHCILSTPPRVHDSWESLEEPTHKISTTLGALSTKIDIGVIYEGLDPGNTHYLISMVCYGLEHYICFVYNRAKENWILYDDDKVKVIGSWDGVLAMCSRKRLQPQLLFFEVKGSVSVTPLEETKVPDNPWEVRKAKRKRSGNHGKAKQDFSLFRLFHSSQRTYSLFGLLYF